MDILGVNNMFIDFSLNMIKERHMAWINTNLILKDIKYKMYESYVFLVYHKSPK